ncbi:MAG: metalloprotease [Planctomycetaceae bacterium]|nr:MAG: metalloprotease [Planctomycetaceae bacterium]
MALEMMWMLAQVGQNPLGFIGGLAGAVLGLGLVIFLHELGHFAVAKWCRVHVERFSLGFGPILLSWKWGETEYALSAIPIGGYVKMLGQDDADPSQLTNEEIAADPRSYPAKTVWQRMAIISAGVVMNLLSAVLFFVAVFSWGREVPPPVIGSLLVGMPAWQAGLQRGDQITHINGQLVTNYHELQINVAVSRGPLELRGIRRTGEAFTTVVHPDRSGTRPQIGVWPSMDLTVAEHLPPGKTSPALPGTAASRAEPPFEPGDRILQVNDQPVERFADFQDLLAARQGAPTRILVRRQNQTAPVEIKVGTNYFRRLGLRLDTGTIASVQAGSPAEQAGLQVGDKLARIDSLDVGTDLDPLKLPDFFSQHAGQPLDVVVVRQQANSGPIELTLKLSPQPRPAWLEAPETEGTPIAIASIGAAYHVVPFILQVEPGSPAELAGIQPNSFILKVELILPEGVATDSYDKRVLSIDLDPANPRKQNNWAFAFWMMQMLPEREVRLTVKEKDRSEPRQFTLKPREDSTWPRPTLGLQMQPLTYRERADSPLEALHMAWRESRNSIITTYITLANLITRQLSVKELRGPLSIATFAYESARSGLVELLQFLGFLSINLAVINFLPIPVLDGGHMVFLLWEAITRKRPSDRVLIGASYAGLAFLLLLMGLVFYLDIFVHGLGMGE